MLSQSLSLSLYRSYAFSCLSVMPRRLQSVCLVTNQFSFSSLPPLGLSKYSLSNRLRTSGLQLHLWEENILDRSMINTFKCDSGQNSQEPAKATNLPVSLASGNFLCIRPSTGLVNGYQASACACLTCIVKERELRFYFSTWNSQTWWSSTGRWRTRQRTRRRGRRASQAW